jgi:transposase
MAKKYTINLTEVEIEKLRSLIRCGKSKARTITRARIVLMAFEGKTDQTISQSLGVSVATVERTRAKFAKDGDVSLNDRPHPPKQPKLDGSQEAFLIATACSKAPEGRSGWTMKLLAERLVSLEIVDSISDETVRRTLKKTKLSRGLRNNGVFPR